MCQLVSAGVSNPGVRCVNQSVQVRTIQVSGVSVNQCRSEQSSCQVFQSVSAGVNDPAVVCQSINADVTNSGVRCVSEYKYETGEK